MNRVHRAIIDYVRQHSVDDTLLALTDQQLLYHLFANHRSMRLTHFGLDTLQKLFTAYTVSLPADERVLPKHLICLDRDSLPYYLAKEQMVVFDYEFAVKLRLVGGRLSTLLEDEV